MGPIKTARTLSRRSQHIPQFNAADSRTMLDDQSQHVVNPGHGRVRMVSALASLGSRFRLSCKPAKLDVQRHGQNSANPTGFALFCV